MLRRILLATDFADHTRSAEIHALGLAKAFGAKVDVLHAIEPIPIDEGDRSFDEFFFKLEKKAEAAIGKIAESFRAAGVECTTRIVIESRWRAVLARAETERAELIVMGSRRYREGEHRTAGTTSHRVFLATRVPLLIVREDEARNIAR